MSSESLWTIDDVAAYLRISERGVRRLVASGDLQPYRLGRLLRFEPDDVRGFVTDLRRPERPTRSAKPVSVRRSRPLTGAIGQSFAEVFGG